MKKTIALLIALLTLSAVGCGKVESNDTAPAETAAETSAAETTAEASAPETAATTTTTAAETTTATTTTAAETTEAPEKPAVDEKVMFNDDNCKIVYKSMGPDGAAAMPLDELDKDTVYRMADHAVQQLNAILEQDKQKYFDLYNLPALLKNEAVGRALLYRLSDPTDLNNNYFFAALLDVEGTRIEGLEVTDLDSASTEEEYMKMACDNYSRLADVITPENAYFMSDNNDLESFKRVYNKLSDSIDSHIIRESDDVSAQMWIYQSSRSETGETAVYHLTLDNGENMFSIRGRAWTDGTIMSVYTVGI